MEQNFHLKKTVDCPVEVTSLAGFVVKSLPTTVHVSTWVGDTELRAELSLVHAEKLARALLSRNEIFVGAERIKRYRLTTNAS